MLLREAIRTAGKLSSWANSVLCHTKPQHNISGISHGFEGVLGSLRIVS